MLSRRELVRLLAGGLWMASGHGRARADSTPEGSIRFVNAVPGCGLDFVLRNGATGHKYQVETLPGGLGVIDFDNDGWPDLYCVNGAELPGLKKTDKTFSNQLYRNNREGGFVNVTERAGLQGHGYEMGTAIGDYNNDGLEDIYVVGVHGNTLYRNNGDGTFTDVTEAAGVSGAAPDGRRLWSVAAAWIDYDNDGNLDLFVSNYCDWEPGTDPICGGSADVGKHSYCHPDRYRAEPMVLYRNNGNGTFSDVSRQTGLAQLLGKGMGVAVADFAGDGRPGLFVANDNARNLLIRNRLGKLQEIGIEAGVAYNGDGRQISGMGADFADINGDGLPDIVMTGLGGETFELFVNRGDGSFDDGSAGSGIVNLSQSWSGWGCGLVDLDNDGWLDLFIACGGLDTDAAQPNRVLRNHQGKFTDVSAQAGPDFGIARLHRGAAFADFDNDGRLDVVVSSLNGPLELWMNRSPIQHWLQIKLRGRRSNRSALGARIVCSGASRTQVRSVANSVGYASSSDLRVHFGLGDDQEVSLEIHWPSGKIQHLSKVRANQQLKIDEPA